MKRESVKSAQTVVSAVKPVMGWRVTADGSPGPSEEAAFELKLEWREALGTKSSDLWSSQRLASLEICSWRRLLVLSHAGLFSTPRTVVPQVPLAMGFPGQEYWSRLPFPSPSWCGYSASYVKASDKCSFTEWFNKRGRYASNLRRLNSTKRVRAGLLGSLKMCCFVSRPTTTFGSLPPSALYSGPLPSLSTHFLL